MILLRRARQRLQRDKAEKLLYKLSVILIILAMMIASVAGFGLNAQADEVSPMALADYDPVDVAVINNIILNNNLIGYSIDAPDNWDFVIWSAEPLKKAEQLNLIGRGLTGDMDLTGLTDLWYLECSFNSLTSLNLSGLTSLKEVKQ